MFFTTKMWTEKNITQTNRKAFNIAILQSSSVFVFFFGKYHEWEFIVTDNKKTEKVLVFGQTHIFSFPLKTLAANSRKCEKRMAKNVNECPFSKLFSKWLNINFYGEQRNITHKHDKDMILSFAKVLIVLLYSILWRNAYA